MSGLTPAQAEVLDEILTEHGPTVTLHAVAELCRQKAGVLDEEMREKWETIGDQIDEVAYGLLD